MFGLDPYKKKTQLEIGKRGVEKDFVNAIRRTGGKAYKFTSEMNRGVSDRIVVYPDQVWFVEIKREDGKLTPLQRDFAGYIKKLNLNHYVVYGQQGIKDFIKVVEYGKSKTR
jgi:hypothetical protein